ncbi:hypothetical protein ACOMHN_020271 [Nucella lapillus]
MGAGDFFGEIGILNLDGGINRRTADVRSVGYSELFVLSRDDVLGALKDHPDAEGALTECARSRLDELLRDLASKRPSVSNPADASKPFCQFSGEEKLALLQSQCTEYLCVLSLFPQSIIRDYGQRRLREIEAHRQKVKPLKLGLANRRLLSMRNSTGATTGNNLPSPTPTPCSPEGSGGGSPGGPLHSQACTGVGGKTYTYCYTNEDAESPVTFSPSERSFFQSVCSSVRRIFHRKVRRQKEGGGAGGEEADLQGVSGKFAWMPDEQRHSSSSSGGSRVVKLCCSAGSNDPQAKQEDYIAVSAPARDSLSTRLPQSLYNPPSGYSAVLTEEEENSRCPSPQSPLKAVPGSADTRRNHLLSNVVEMPAQASSHTLAEVNATDDVDEEVGSCFASPTRGAPEILCMDVDGEITSALDSKANSAAADEGGGGVACEQGAQEQQNYLDNFILVARDDPCVRPHVHRRCSEPVAHKCPHSRRKSSESSIMSTLSSTTRLGALPSGSLEMFRDQGAGGGSRPCIRVESASTLESESSVDQVSLGRSNFLHPDYFPHTLDQNDGSDDDVDDVIPRSRSNSAPNIVAHALPDSSSSVHLPSRCATAHLSPSGSPVAVGPIAASPTVNRANLFQRRLSSWAKLDGSNRYVPATSSDRLEPPRCTPWTPATDPLLPSREASLLTTAVDKEQLTSLLTKLNDAHTQLHSRMSELEAAYTSSAQRLDKLGTVQEDMLALLTARHTQGSDSGNVKAASATTLSPASEDRRSPELDQGDGVETTAL